MSTVPTNGYLHELHQASAHLVHFIKNFLEVFPEWKGVDVSPVTLRQAVPSTELT